MIVCIMRTSIIVTGLAAGSLVMAMLMTPVFGAGDLEAVCATDITPAEEFEVEN